MSALHPIDATELWHFYCGAPLDLRQVTEHGSQLSILGSDVSRGQVPEVVVEAGVWRSARPMGPFSLVGATVTPAFTFEGFGLRDDP